LGGDSSNTRTSVKSRREHFAFSLPFVAVHVILSREKGAELQ
jgi:hypothetical protein